jgi:hypothetical protein
LIQPLKSISSYHARILSRRIQSQDPEFEKFGCLEAGTFFRLRCKKVKEKIELAKLLEWFKKTYHKRRF